MLVEVDLVRQLKEKDVAAFGQLYDCYAPALYGLIFKLTPDSKVATTILENSFLKFWRQIGLFDVEKDKLFTWMVRIMIEECKDVLKLQNGVILRELQLKTPFQDSAQIY